jgi:hypothetical protein
MPRLARKQRVVWQKLSAIGTEACQYSANGRQWRIPMAVMEGQQRRRWIACGASTQSRGNMTARTRS